MVVCNAIVIAKKAKRAARARNKAARKKTLDDEAQSIHNARRSNNGAVPHKFISNLVSTMKSECPLINRNMINYHFKTWSERTDKLENEVVVAAASVPVAVNAGAITVQPETSISRGKGGRPKNAISHT